MRAIAFLLPVVFAAAVPAPAQGIDPEEFVRLEKVMRAAMLKVAPSVVTVETFGGTRRVLTGDGGGDGIARPKRPDRPGDDKKEEGDKKKKPILRLPGFQQSQGRSTGVVLGADGWILVSRFALNFDPTTILVTLSDGRTLPAERRGEDTSRGLALLKVDAADLPVPQWVHPDDVRVGQWAFVLGRTFGGDEPTVHMGMVSAVRRQFGRALQIDAWTSPANYGGAVIDIHGRVLGIAVPLSPSGRDAGAEWYDSGIGFAATVADIPELIERMKQGEVLHRGWLGVRLSPDHLGPGALLAEVPRDGVAHKAGLRKGDTIVAVDGVEVMNSFHLQMLISSRMGGDPVHLLVRKRRGEEPEGMTLFLADTPYEERREKKEAELPASFPLPGNDQGR